MSESLRDYAGGDSAFYHWLVQVDHEVQSRVGVSLLDLPDLLLRDLYDDGTTPAEAAREAIFLDSLDA